MAYSVVVTFLSPIEIDEVVISDLIESELTDLLYWDQADDMAALEDNQDGEAGCVFQSIAHYPTVDSKVAVPIITNSSSCLQ